MGYASKRSVPSLVAGLSFAAVYAAAGYQIDIGSLSAGHTTALAASMILSGVMGSRASKAKNFKSVPGVLTALGTASAVLEAWQLYKTTV